MTPTSPPIDPKTTLICPTSLLIPHPSSLTPRPSSLIPHPSSLIPPRSSLFPFPSSRSGGMHGAIEYGQPSFRAKAVLGQGAEKGGKSSFRRIPAGGIRRQCAFRRAYVFPRPSNPILPFPNLLKPLIFIAFCNILVILLSLRSVEDHMLILPPVEDQNFILPCFFLLRFCSSRWRFLPKSLSYLNPALILPKSRLCPA